MRSLPEPEVYANPGECSRSQARMDSIFWAVGAEVAATMERLHMARVVVTTLGTLGDLHPMFPVAKKLRERGHTVHFVVPPKLQRIVVEEGFAGQGVELMPNPPPETYSDNPAKAKARIERYYTPFLRRAIAVLSDACSDADVLLSTPHQVATAIVGKSQK